MSSVFPSLDPYRHNRNNFCGQWSVEGQEQGRWHYARLGCKRWACPRCGPKKARRLRHAIVKKATELGLQRFLTLTLDPVHCAPEDSIAYVRDCWSKFRTYLKRRYGSSISFITVLELQKSGYAHLHILVDRYIEQRWISEAWQAVGGGRIVDIRYVDIHRIAAYLSKYLTKEVLTVTLRSRQRRYTTSRDIVLFAKEPSGKWSLIIIPIEFLYQIAQGKVVQEQREEDGGLRGFIAKERVGRSRIPLP